MHLYLINERMQNHFPAQMVFYDLFTSFYSWYRCFNAFGGSGA